MRNYSYMTASADVKAKISQVLRALGVDYEVSGGGSGIFTSYKEVGRAFPLAEAVR